MSVIPFPVCEYAANHCREGRRLGNISNYIEGRQLKNNKLGLSSAKLSRAKFGYLEVIFEVVSKDNLKQYEHCLELLFETPKNMLL